MKWCLFVIFLLLYYGHSNRRKNIRTNYSEKRFTGEDMIFSSYSEAIENCYLMLKLRNGKSSFETYCEQVFLSSVEYSSRVMYSRLLRTLSSQVFYVSEDEDFTVSQSNPFQCLTTLTLKKFFS